MPPFLRLLPFALAPALLPAQHDYLHEQVQQALTRARPALLQHLQAGARQAAMPGELALLCLAALHDGVPADDAVLEPALRRLADANPQNTYDLALRLMVAEAGPALPGRDKLAKADLKQLLKHANAGGFHYHRSSSWDLSNTQYGALGLRAAKALGLDVPGRIWQRLAEAALDAQREDGSFGYTPGNDGTASMTAAGIAVLQVCAQNLEPKGKQAAKIAEAVARGWQWFDTNAALVGDPSVAWSYYFHYGLERAGILSDVTAVGGADWYRKGAGMLLDQQGGGGGWNSAPDFTGNQDARRGSAVPTAFAILFLRRKFQKLAGPVTGAPTIALPMLDAQSTAADVQACADYLVRRGKEGLGDVLKALRDELPARRRAAFLALRQQAGQDFGFDPARDAEANREALRAAELWYLKQR